MYRTYFEYIVEEKQNNGDLQPKAAKVHAQ